VWGESFFFFKWFIDPLLKNLQESGLGLSSTMPSRFLRSYTCWVVGKAGCFGEEICCCLNLNEMVVFGKGVPVDECVLPVSDVGYWWRGGMLATRCVKKRRIRYIASSGVSLSPLSLVSVIETRVRTSYFAVWLRTPLQLDRLESLLAKRVLHWPTFRASAEGFPTYL
jgi:hypothetical protein